MNHARPVVLLALVGCSSVTTPTLAPSASLSQDDALSAALAAVASAERISAGSPVATLLGEGSSTYPQFAGRPRTLATADVNGDGYDDAIISSWQYNDGAETPPGAAYVFLGSASGLSTTIATRLDGVGRNGYFGYQLASAGDVDGDGYDDVLIEASATTGATALIQLYRGTSTGLETSAAVELPVTTAGSFGTPAFTGLGDVNGDGYDDVAVGDYIAGGTGEVKIYAGSAAGLSSTATLTLTAPSGSTALGDAAAGADVNHDGYADLVATSRTSGKLFVYAGSASGLGTTPTSTSTIATSTNTLALVAGDYDGDSYDDVVVGDQVGTRAARVFRGTATGFGATYSSSISGAPGNNFGAAIAADDVNGDGRDDLLLSSLSGSTYTVGLYLGSASGPATTASATLSGAYPTAGDYDGDGYGDALLGTDHSTADLYRGSASGLATTATVSLHGDDWSNFGYAVASDGDVNGDGFDDVAVSSTYGDYVYIFLGSATGVSSSWAARLAGPQLDTYYGYGLDWAGDVNGDGYDDLLVGDYDYGATNHGRVYLYLGGASGPASAPSTTLSTGGAADYFGAVLAGIGDVNRDGYDDVAAGAAYGAGSRGQVFVYLGSASGLVSTPATTLTGTSVSGYLGLGIAGAGDVNADGYDDLAVSAPWISSVGAVYIHHGSASGISTTPARTLTGTVANALFGFGLDGAGDVDGDGYGDLVVGAPYTNTSYGAIALYRGSASGIAATASQNVAGTASGGAFGYTVRGLGDTDGDGYTEIAAYGTTTTYNAWVYPGSAGGLDTAGVVTVSGSGSDHFAWALGGGGDADGNGHTELVVGAYAAAPAGAVYVYADSAPSGDPDADGDGYPASTDCDDHTASVHPGGTEVCDAADVDDDCDGLTDNADDSTVGLNVYYTDRDADGYGDAASTVHACEAPTGAVADATDCDDGRADVRPGGAEVCDALDADEDCDGLVDDADPTVSGRFAWHTDADGDGYGDAATYGFTCDLPATASTDATDCDDTRADVHPGGAEVCDALDADEDCDGLVEDADSSTAFASKTLWYADTDADGYGNATSNVAACAQPAGTSADATDCNDAVAAINPAAAEVCDAADVDEDCDALADDADPSATGPSTFYTDGDGDGYGAAATPVQACDLPTGASALSTDCDDGDAAIRPDGVEVCDAASTDEDCDGFADDADPGATGTSTWYADVDGDGYGDSAAPTEACHAPDGSVATTDDCNDRDAAVYPGAPETCDDDRDLNCDGAVGGEDGDGDGYAACDDCDDTDPSVTLPTPAYVDADGDGYGTGAAVDRCTLGDGYAAVNGDCEDTDAAYHPYAPETDCTDPNDYNCDGSAGGEDADGDGYAACQDCDDGEALQNPGAAEVCDADDLDEDCDGLADDADGAVDLDTVSIWYADADGDGHGDPTAVRPACDAPEGYVANGDDCDDADADAFPGAPEVAGDGVDQDCNGADLPADTGETGETDDSGETGETGETGDSQASDDTGGGEKDGGCGCGAPGGAAAWPAALAMAALVRRRRR